MQSSQGKEAFQPKSKCKALATRTNWWVLVIKKKKKKRLLFQDSEEKTGNEIGKPVKH